VAVPKGTCKVACDRDLEEQPAQRFAGAKAKLVKGSRVKARLSRTVEALGEEEAQGRHGRGLHLSVFPRRNGLLPG
jgi:hypothetical protein